MPKLFGTDGVRGAANTEITPELAFNLGRAGAYILTKANAHPNVIIGTDSRISGDMLQTALTAGMCSVGANVMLAGVVPTPTIAYITRKNKLDAGVVVSASHNAFGDNGIKFFSNGGFKLRDELEDEIEDIIQNNKLDTLPRATSTHIGRIIDAGTPANDYIDYLESTLNGADFSSLKIALDCANGATSRVAPELFKRTGANLVIINNNPNGININANCGSTHVDGLISTVKEHNCDIGVAFDGDGDRLICIDETGAIIDGDQIMAICGHYLASKKRLPQNTIVATVMSNLGLFEMGKKYGITIEQTKVGDRYVLERMLEGGFKLGGEQSGHIIFSEHATTGDGILSSLMLISAMKANNAKLSELASIMEKFPQILVGAPVPAGRKEMYKTNDYIQNRIAELDKKYAGMGRVLIRPSGTEPLVRVMIEGKNIDEITADAKSLAADIERLSHK